MDRKTSSRMILVVVLALHVLALAALIAQGHEHDGKPCRWRPDRPAGTGIVIRWAIDPDFRLPGVDRDEAIGMIRRAWADWSQIADVDAVQVECRDRANVFFTTADTDGPGLEAAHAGFPCQARGRRVPVVFDRTEDWDAPTFLDVARHEVGHVLGVSHSYSGTWMQPTWDKAGGEASWWEQAEVTARYGAAR